MMIVMKTADNTDETLKSCIFNSVSSDSRYTRDAKANKLSGDPINIETQLFPKT